MITELRNEIIESQKARTSLLDKKLIIVAAVGTVGLGKGFFGSDSNSSTIVILCLIPLVSI
jgi:hypothetical protein